MSFGCRSRAGNSERNSPFRHREPKSRFWILNCRPHFVLRKPSHRKSSRSSRPCRRQDRIARFFARLSAPKRSSFSFSLEGDYPVPAGPGSASFGLPRLLGVSERSAEVVATAPSRFDLRGSVRTWGNGKPGSWPIAMVPDAADTGVRIRAALERPIAIADLTWRTAASTASVQSESDVDMDESRIRVVQKLRFRFIGQTPDRVHLRSSRPVLGLQLTGGTLEAATEGWDISLSGQPTRNPEVTLSYSTPAPAADAEITLPLLAVESGDVVQSVRIWTTRRGRLQLSDDPDWSESATEIVAGRSVLPNLVIKARGLVAPPTLSWRPTSNNAENGPGIERARIEVALGEVDAIYRCQYWLRDWRSDAELILPSGARVIEVDVRGKRLPLASGTNGGTPFRIGLRRPAGTPALALVEVRYRGSARQLETPSFADASAAESETWIISGPPESLVLVPREASGAWSIGALLNMFGAGGPRATADFAGGGNVVVRRAGMHEMTVVQVPRVAWVVGWSTATFLLCFFAAMMGRRTRQLLAVLAIIGFASGLILLPQPLAAATFASIPGLFSFLVVALGYRWMRVRYRRRVAKAVGFARPGSSLVRPSAPSSRQRDSVNRPVAPTPVPTPSSS